MIQSTTHERRTTRSRRISGGEHGRPTAKRRRAAEKIRSHAEHGVGTSATGKRLVRVAPEPERREFWQLWKSAGITGLFTRGKYKCPFHQDHRTSLTIDPLTATFGCTGPCVSGPGGGLSELLQLVMSASTQGGDLFPCVETDIKWANQRAAELFPPPEGVTPLRYSQPRAASKLVPGGEAGRFLSWVAHTWRAPGNREFLLRLWFAATAPRFMASKEIWSRTVPNNGIGRYDDSIRNAIKREATKRGGGGDRRAVAGNFTWTYFSDVRFPKASLLADPVSALEKAMLGIPDAETLDRMLNEENGVETGSFTFSLDDAQSEPHRAPALHPARGSNGWSLTSMERHEDADEDDEPIEMDKVSWEGPAPEPRVWREVAAKHGFVPHDRLMPILGLWRWLTISIPADGPDDQALWHRKLLEFWEELQWRCLESGPLSTAA